MSPLSLAPSEVLGLKRVPLFSECKSNFVSAYLQMLAEIFSDAFFFLDLDSRVEETKKCGRSASKPGLQLAKLLIWVRFVALSMG